MGVRHHTGENQGTPFQISTSASYGPIRRGDLGGDRRAGTPSSGCRVARRRSRCGAPSPAGPLRPRCDAAPRARSSAQRRMNSSACTSRAAGVGVVEVAPRQHVHAPDAPPIEVGDEPGEIGVRRRARRAASRMARRDDTQSDSAGGSRALGSRWLPCAACRGHRRPTSPSPTGGRPRSPFVLGGDLVLARRSVAPTVTRARHRCACDRVIAAARPVQGDGQLDGRGLHARLPEAAC